MDKQRSSHSIDPVNRPTQAAAQTSAERFAHNRAVIIGIDRYQHIRPLRTAVNDAQRLAKFLRGQLGYDDVTLLKDASRGRLTTELGRRLAARVGSGDRLLLYFAGHGIALDGDDGPEGYLIPADAKEDDSSTFVAMSDLYSWLNALPCRHLLVILDCCFAGAFTWYGRRSVRPIGAKLFREHYDRFVREPAWQILTSAAHDQEALDVVGGKAIGVRGEHTSDSKQHSPFADALFAALQGEGDLIPKGQGDGVVTATELYLYLRQTVEVKHRQTPELWPFSRTRHGKGEFIFLVPGHGEPDLPPAPELTTDNNPYRGLQSYDEQHAALFFGRRALIEKLAAVVDQHPLTVVLGASGTGKSSVVKAGVVPHLKMRDEEISGADAEMQQSERPRYSILPPMRPGDAPLRVLGELVAANLPGMAQRSPSIASTIHAWLVDNPHQRLLLVVDQVEELVTLCRDDTRKAFLQVLADLVAAHPDRVHIIFTLRTDFEPQFENSPLDELWRDGRFVVPPMSQADLREVIEGPATVSVLIFDPPELVDTLIDEVIQTPGALPLLSFTLEQLYLKYIDRQKQAQHNGVMLERSLTGSDYAALGGVIGSLRRRADEVHDDLPDDDHRATMQRVMLRMVAVEGSEVARRQLQRDELIYPSSEENGRVEAVLQHLVAARLVVTSSIDADGDSKVDPIVEPAHDALVAAWDRLLVWRREAENILPLSLHRELTRAATRWANAPDNDKTQYLWNSEPRLPVAEAVIWPTAPGRQDSIARWLRHLVMPVPDPPTTPTILNDGETTFVQKSVVRRTFVIRRLAGIAVTAVAVVAVLIFAALWSWQSSTASKAQADTESELRSEVERLNRSIQADRLTTKGLYFSDKDPPLALLLAVQGFQFQHGVTQSSPFTDTRINYDLEQDAYVTSTTVFTTGETVGGSAQTNMHELLSIIGGISLPSQGSDILAMAFSPMSNQDGGNVHWLATASHDGTARLWDLTTNDPIQNPFVLPGHQSGVSALAFSPDAHWLATGSDDRTVRLWDLTTADPALDSIVLNGHTSSVNAVVFSPNGHWLATASDDNTVRLWSITKDGPAWDPVVLQHFAAGVSAIAFSPSDRWLATSSYDGTTRLWDLAEDDPAQSPIVLRRHKSSVNAVAFSPDGHWLGTASTDNTALLWDLTKTEPGQNPVLLGKHTGRVNDIDFSPDGNWVATASFDHIARLWKLTSDGPTQAPIVLRGHESRVNTVAFSPDGHWLASASGDPSGDSQSHKSATVRLWDLVAGDPAQAPTVLRGHVIWVRSMAFSADSRWLATTGDVNTSLPISGTTHLWNLTSDNRAQDRVVLQGHEAGVLSVAFSPDSRWLATASSDHTARLWDLTATAPAEHTIVLQGHTDIVKAVAFSPNSRWLATSSSDGTARLWDLTRADLASDVIVLQGHTDIVDAVAFSSDGHWLATTSHDGTARLWDITAENPARSFISLRGHTSFVLAIAFSPDGHWLATASVDGTVRLWDLMIGDPSQNSKVLRHNGGGVGAVAFSPNGHWLATMSNGAAHIWDITLPIPTARPVVLPGMANIVSGIAFSPDSHWLATTSEGNSARLWNLEAKDQSLDPVIFLGHTDGVLDIAFSPDGRWLATASIDGTAILWKWSVDDLIELACRGAGRNLDATEWQRYFKGRPYQRTCDSKEGWPVHPSVIQFILNEATSLAQQGDIAGSMAKFEEARALDPSLPTVAEAEVKHIYALALVDQGHYLANQSDLAGVVDKFQEALALDPSVGAPPPRYFTIVCAMQPQATPVTKIDSLCAKIGVRVSPITVGETVTGAVAARAHELWRFEVTDAITATIDLTAYNSDLYANLYLYAPDGSLVAKNDYPSGHDSRIEAALSQAGRYVIGAAGYEDSSGTYRLTLSTTGGEP